MTSCQHTAYYNKAWLVIVVLCFILYILMHTEKIPRLSKQCSLINIRTVWKIFTSSGLHVHTVELVLIQGNNINKPYFINVKQHSSSYFITHLKNYLTKLSTLYRFQSSNPLQNITSAVQFQQDTLQFCKLESERDELFINYSHAAAKRFFNS